MNTKSCTHYSDFYGRFSSTSLWPIKFDSTAGIRTQTFCDLSDVRASAGASHGCTLRHSILLSCSWRPLLQARDDKAADERRFSALKPQSFSPSSVVCGELVTRTSVTSDARHGGCSLMRERHDNTNTHAHARRTPSCYGFHLNANGVWNSINPLSLQSENMLLAKVSRRAKDGYWVGNHGSDLVLFESSSNLGWLTSLCACKSIGLMEATPHVAERFKCSRHKTFFVRACFDTAVVHMLLIHTAEDRSVQRQVILHLVLPLLREIRRSNAGLQVEIAKPEQTTQLQQDLPQSHF